YFAQQGDVIAIQIALDEDANAAEVRERLQSAIESSDLDGSLDALTVDDAVDVKTDLLSGGNSAIAALLLGFAGISVVVPILVVSNTFSVIVDGRRRELALQRCLCDSRGTMYAYDDAEKH